MLNKMNKSILLSFGAALILAGCGHDSDNMQKYKITLKNLTFQQTFAPSALLIKDSNDLFEAYDIGTSASIGLEKLAEGGDSSSLIEEATNSNIYYAQSIAGATAPGGSKEFIFEVDKSKKLTLSLLTMLIKTNDAFVATKNISLDFSGKKNIFLNVYDSGTEVNNELSTDIPALSGEGFNALRTDSSDIVTIHSGIIGSDDGLSSSNLTSADKWDNPAASLTIEKIY